MDVACIYFKAMFSRNDENISDVFTSAKNELIEVMELEPTDVGCMYLSDILCRLAKMKYEDKKYEEATKYYKQATHYGEIMVKICPSAIRYCLFADTCFKANDHRASELYLRAIELGSSRACFH
jgi:TPR repeat protein